MLQIVEIASIINITLLREKAGYMDTYTQQPIQTEETAQIPQVEQQPFQIPLAEQPPIQIHLEQQPIQIHLEQQPVQIPMEQPAQVPLEQSVPYTQVQHPARPRRRRRPAWQRNLIKYWPPIRFGLLALILVLMLVLVITLLFI